MITTNVDKPVLEKPLVSKNSKYVFSFTEGDGKNKQLLGGKGANLCEMTQLGLNVPPGFVISTEACLNYLDNPSRTLPQGLMEDVRLHIQKIERMTGKSFGDPENPLLDVERIGRVEVRWVPEGV